MQLKRKTKAPLSPLAWTAFFRFKGPTAIPPRGTAGGGREVSLAPADLKRKTGRGRDRTLSFPTVQPLLFNTTISLHILAATQCNVNDYLLCSDLYQLKNHYNLDLICLYNKWFVYTELDALPQLLEISLNDKSLVRPCLGNSETAALLHMPPLY